MSDAELLKMACEFDMGPIPISMGCYKWWEKYPRDARNHHVYVKNMGPAMNDSADYFGDDRWGIFIDSNRNCLNKNGLWEYQPMPSSRTEKFFARCRYASLHEAVDYYKRWETAINTWAEKMLSKGKTVLNSADCPAKLRKFSHE